MWMLYGLLCANSQACMDITDNYASGMTAFNEQRFSDARSYFTAYLEPSAQDEHAQSAQWYIARCYWEEADYENFAIKAKEFGVAYPGTEQADFLRFIEALTPFRELQWKAAVSSFDTFLARNPASAYAGDVRFMRCRCLYDLSRYDDFISAADEFENKHPTHLGIEFVIHCRSLAAESRKDWSEAATRLESFIKRFPDSEFTPTSMYLLAYSNRQLGKQKDDQALIQKSNSQFANYRTVVVAIIANSSTSSEIRGRYDVELLKSYEKQEDFDGLVVAAGALRARCAPRSENHVLATYFMALGLSSKADNDNELASELLDQVLADDSSSIVGDSMLAYGIVACAQWRISIARKVHGEEGQTGAKAVFRSMVGRLPTCTWATDLMNRYDAYLAPQ